MVRLLDELWAISGFKISHPWDASAYLLAGPEPTLIDCGCTEGYPSLKRSLEEFGYEPSDIRAIISTHGHWDHVSAAAKLQEESDAKLYIHPNDRKQVETGDYELTASFLYGKPFYPVNVYGELQDGQVFHVNGFDLSVIHTPGHTMGSISLLTEIHGTRVLIAGDTIWGGYHRRIGSDLNAWADSLDKLLKHEFDVMSTGHIPPMLIFDAKKQVREARKQLGVYFNPWFKPFNVQFTY